MKIRGWRVKWSDPSRLGPLNLQENLADDRVGLAMPITTTAIKNSRMTCRRLRKKHDADAINGAVGTRVLEREASSPSAVLAKLLGRRDDTRSGHTKAGE